MIWSVHSRRIDPISLSAKPFCQGEPGAMGLSRIPMARSRLAVTERKDEVLLWIARGKSNRDIAEILGVRPRTVNKHLEQVYAKLGVENRTAAAALAVRALSLG
jgi:DNA-binding CsgD family transcriptional regulator